MHAQAGGARHLPQRERRHSRLGAAAAAGAAGVGTGVAAFSAATAFLSTWLRGGK